MLKILINTLKMNRFTTGLNAYYCPPANRSFIRFPRTIVKRLYHPEEHMRQSGWLYFTLIVHCYHSNGDVVFRGKRTYCPSGEYIGSRSCLSRLTHLSPSTVARLLQRLEDEKLIEVETIGVGSRIRIVGYQEITRTGQGKAAALTAGQAFAAYEERLERGEIA